MPSVSLGNWNGPRAAALHEVDAQCAASLALPVPNPLLVEENLRAYVLLVSAHFQGFCRDLFTECAQFISRNVDPQIELLVQQLLTSELAINYGNPHHGNIKSDFSRFGFKLELSKVDPANSARLAQLEELNKWRNAAAHHGLPPKRNNSSLVIPLDLPSINGWRSSCSGLATSLDGIMYNQLRVLIRGPQPWVP